MAALDYVLDYLRRARSPKIAEEVAPPPAPDAATQPRTLLSSAVPAIAELLILQPGCFQNTLQFCISML